RAFAKGDYQKAEAYYTEAIINDSSNPNYYTNRALVRTKLKSWEQVLEDCDVALRLDPQSLKGHHYKALALIALDRATEALPPSQQAYTIALSLKSRSAGTIGQVVLDARKKIWEAREKRRLKQEASLLLESIEGLRKLGECEKEEIRRNARDGSFGYELSEEELESELASVHQRVEQRVEDLKNVFAMSNERAQVREIPEYLMDSITFNIMIDPVVTKHGQSYDRFTILEHLRRQQTDPLTREPMTEEDLRPNLALKNACEEFLEKNGWAADW
ncbi:U-box-domain-containing protein, partial [Ascobolus immersus RN42]